MTQPANGAATLLSTIQQFTAHRVFQHLVLHPFTASSEDFTAVLHDTIQATDQLSHSLNLFSSIPISNPKLVSILRQQTTISHTLHQVSPSHFARSKLTIRQSDQQIRQTILALRTRPGTSYGEDVPVIRTALMDWAVSRLESWAKSLGMETFKDNNMGDGEWTIVLGGKVLVLDIYFSNKLRIDIEKLKTSYAIPGNSLDGTTSNTGNTEGSASLDVLLTGSIRAFLREIQKDPEVLDALEAERLGKVVVDHLGYLMVLDKLAARKDEKNGGMRWFVDADELAVEVTKFAGSEADAVATYEVDSMYSCFC